MKKRTQSLFGDNDPDEEDSEEDQSDKDDNEPAAKKGRLEAEKAPTLNPDVHTKIKVTSMTMWRRR